MGVSSKMLTDFRPARNAGTDTMPSASSSQTKKAFRRIDLCEKMVPATAYMYGTMPSGEPAMQSSYKQKYAPEPHRVRVVGRVFDDRDERW